MKLQLLHPIKIGEKSSVDSLTLRDHTVAADYLAFDQRGGVAQRIALIASVAGTDEALVKRLHGVDYRRAEKEVDRLMAEDEAGANPPASGDGTADTAEDALAKKSGA